MNEEELKQKCKERAKIFQQAMESCHSSSPIDCIEWFADRIAELEKDKQYFSDSLDKQIEATLKLDKENAELDCQKNRNKFCYSCANATERCFKNEIGCPCDKYKSYKDENAELKEQISTKDILIKELQEQRVYWKESSFDWRHKFFKLDKVKRLIKKDKQLTKAKEIIRDLINLTEPTSTEEVQHWNETFRKAEKFLSEVEKC